MHSNTKKTTSKTIILFVLAFSLGFLIINFTDKNHKEPGLHINNVHAQEPTWWNADWKYRRKIIISGRNDKKLEGQQVLINLDAVNFDFNNTNDNGEDIRFTKDDGTSLESFWIESWDKANQSAKIWLRVSTIPKNGNANLYIYYGNSAAGSASDGDATFEFFDNFSQNPNVSGRWTTHSFSNDFENEGAWDKTNRIWYLTKPFQGKAFAAITNYTLPEESWVANFWFLAGGGVGGDGFVFLFYKDGSSYGIPNSGGRLGFETTDETRDVPGYGVEFDGFKNSADPSDQHIAITKNNSDTHLFHTDTPLVKDNVWHKAIITHIDKQITVNIDGSDLLKHTVEDLDYTHKGIGFSSSNGDLDDNHIITDFYIRKYTSSEPQITIEKEEKGKAAPEESASGSISGKIFNDANINGTLDAGDKGIQGITLRLYEDSDENVELDYTKDKLVDTKTTDNNGRYSFSGLLPMSYILDIDQSTLPENYSITTDNEPLFIILNKEVDADGINFGYSTVKAASTEEAIAEIEPIQQTIKPVQEITPVSTEKQELQTSPARPDTTADRLISSETVSDVLTVVIPDPIADRYVEDVYDNETVQNINDATIILATTAGTVSFLPFAVSAIPYLRYLLQFITSPFTILRIRRRKEWGTVYNAFTKQPIDLAIVRLWDQETDKVMGTKVTDAEGRYLFIIKPKKSYYLTAEKPDYNFPSKYMEKISSDKDFSDIYHGETLNLKGGGSQDTSNTEKGIKMLKQPSVTVNIPLDPKEGIAVSADKKASPFKTKIKTLSDTFTQRSREITQDTTSILDALRRTKFRSVLAISGISIATVNFFISLSILTFFLLILQIFFYIILRRVSIGPKDKSWGKVFDTNNENPISGAVVRIFDTRYKKLLSTYTTDDDGKYGFLVGKEKYIVTCEKEGYTFPEKQVIIDGEEIKTVSKDLGIKKSSSEDENDPIRQRLNLLVSESKEELTYNPNIISRIIFSLFFKRKGYTFPADQKAEEEKRERDIKKKEEEKPKPTETTSKTEEEILLATKREKKNIESLRKELEERPGLMSSWLYKFLYKRQKKKDARKSKPKKTK